MLGQVGLESWSIPRWVESNNKRSMGERSYFVFFFIKFILLFLFLLSYSVALRRTIVSGYLKPN